MLSKTLLKALALSPLLASTTLAAPLHFKRDLSFDYAGEKVRGVNLGGWFVLEPWITPSIFEDTGDSSIVDEYTYTKKLGNAAKQKLNDHWNTWITEDDFAQIKKAGLNHVRIPFGYWGITPNEGDPYVSQDQLGYLDKAVGWARSNGIKILLDLHGVPGSQNGFDNSGQYGSVEWTIQANSYQQSLNAIDALAKRYLPNDSDVVAAIELVNEPMGVSGAIEMGSIKQYYYDGYGKLDNYKKDTVTVIHDAFQPFASYWQGFMTEGFSNVLVDTHQYQIFSPAQVALSPTEHVSAACALGSQLSGMDKWAIVGEWTGAQTDCAKYLNGRNKGARYDGTFSDENTPSTTKVGSCDGKYTGTVDALSSDDKSNIRSFIEAQLDAYEQHTGWIFWTWRTESSPEWDMQALLAGGLFPQPLSDRKTAGCS